MLNFVKKTLTCPGIQCCPHPGWFPHVYQGYPAVTPCDFTASCKCVSHAALCEWPLSPLGLVMCPRRLHAKGEGGEGLLGLPRPRGRQTVALQLLQNKFYNAYTFGSHACGCQSCNGSWDLWFCYKL